MRLTSSVGALLAVLALPHVFYTVTALVDLFGAPSPQPGEMMFLDYEVLAAFRWAFVASQGWLLCALAMGHMPSMSRMLRALMLVVGTEAILVYGSVAFLRARGFGLESF